MPTNLQFDGLAIKGHVLPHGLPPLEVQQARTHFWGVVGESVLTGKPGGRSFVIPVFLFDETDFDSAGKITTFLDETLFAKVNVEGLLEMPDTSNKANIPNCTYLDYALRDPILEDVAGTLGGGYFTTIDLLFRQHKR